MVIKIYLDPVSWRIAVVSITFVSFTCGGSTPHGHLRRPTFHGRLRRPNLLHALGLGNTVIWFVIWLMKQKIPIHHIFIFVHLNYWRAIKFYVKLLIYQMLIKKMYIWRAPVLYGLYITYWLSSEKVTS